MDKVRFDVLLVLAAGLIGSACDRSPGPGDTIETRSAVTAVAETPEQAAVRKFQARADRRATIDGLKAQLAATEDSPRRRALEQTLRAKFADHVADVEGTTPPPPPGTPDVVPSPPVRTRAQNDALLAKMAKYDMNNPADVAAWDRVKAQELGQ